MDTLCKVISRSWPASSTPPTNAYCKASTKPNNKNATVIEAIVSEVRKRRRPRLAHSKGRYLNMLLSRSGGCSGAHQLTFIKVQHAFGAFRRTRIVRHHDDGLALLCIERLQ